MSTIVYKVVAQFGNFLTSATTVSPESIIYHKNRWERSKYKHGMLFAFDDMIAAQNFLSEHHAGIRMWLFESIARGKVEYIYEIAGRNEQYENYWAHHYNNKIERAYYGFPAPWGTVGVKTLMLKTPLYILDSSYSPKMTEPNGDHLQSIGWTR